MQVGHVATEQGLSLGGTAGFRGLIMMEGICMAWFSVFRFGHGCMDGKDLGNGSGVMG